MSDKYHKLSPGERIRRIDTGFYNELVDMARERAARFHAQPDIGTNTSGVLISNDSGSELVQYAVVGLGTPLVDPDDSEDEFLSRKGFVSAATVAGDPFAILQEPLLDGTIGDAIIHGVTQCKVNVTDVAHQFADAGNGNYTNLVSGTTGRAEILWAEGGTGVQWAIVNIRAAPGVVPVSTGGTGGTSFTAYAVICAGATSTGPLQNVSGLGTSGYVLTSNGAGALPTWQAAAGGGVTSVDVSGGSTGLTFSGGPITTSGTITMAGTLDVDNGGTGRTSHTAWAVLCGGTTSTGQQQSVASVGVSGQPLVSAGAGALPAFGNSITLGVAGTATGTLLLKGTSSGTVTITVAAAAGGWTLTLPNSSGSSGNVMTTNGSGTMSWTAGTISGVALGQTLANLTATDSTLTFSGTYTGAVNRTVGVNLASSNTWTGKQLIPGTTTADSAAAGYLGEYLSSLVAEGSKVSGATTSPENMTTLSLTAGDWDVEAHINFYLDNLDAGEFQIEAGFNTTTKTLPTDGTQHYFMAEFVDLTTGYTTITLTRKRYNVNASTTVYCVFKSIYSGTDIAAFGSMTARRVR